MREIEFLYDFGSPNAWFVHRAIPAYAARGTVTFRYVPVLLGGVFKATGNQSPMQAYGHVAAKRDYDMLEIRRFIQRHGITGFTMNPHFPVNTLLMMRGAGKIFVTGATAGLRGNPGYSAFAAAKAGLRAMAQSAARELWPQGLHVAHLGIDAGVDTAWVRTMLTTREGPDALADPDRLMPPAAVAEAYWALYNQPKSAWTFEQEIRPYGEKW